MERRVRWLPWTPKMLEMERLVVQDEMVDMMSAGKLNVILSQPGVLHGGERARGRQWNGK